MPEGPSLAERLVAAHFPYAEGKLRAGGVDVAALAEAHGTPLFVYDAGLMRATYRALRMAMRGFAEVVYSVKANPNPAVIAVFREEGAGAEIASGAEFAAALQAGVAPSDILFAGPGKGAAELERAVAAGIGEIHLENAEEVERLSAIATRLGRQVRVAIRVNPDAAAQGGAMRMGGKPSPFGFDEEDLDTAIDRVEAAPGLELTGLHLFAGTQTLQAATLLTQWRHGLGLAARLAGRIGRPLHTIDLGGGLGIPYFSGDSPLDLAELTAGLDALRAERDAMKLGGARILLEPGRYLVGPAGLYVARLRAAKSSRGQHFAITDGGMHHHLAASGNLGQVVKRDFPLVPVAERAGAARQPWTVTGPLCTPLDILARAAPLPELREGDLVAVLQSGAYALTASPTGFLSHPTPAEVLVEGGQARVIRARAGD